MRARAIRGGQRGAGLVLLMGIVAALGILSAALVFAVSSARVNTSRDQQTTTAFNVAEAALDVTMEELASSWPQREQGAYSDWSEGDRPAFASEVLGTATPSPRPDNLPYVNVRVFDDLADPTSAASGWEWGTPSWDANHNGIIFVDAQARVRDRAVRIRASVAADYYHLPLPKAVAIWADHTLSSTGSGTDADVTAEVLYDTQAAIHGGVFGEGTTTLWDPALFYPDSSDDSARPLSQDDVEELVRIAKDSHRYFSGADAEAQMKTELQGQDSGPWEGLIVLDYRESGSTAPVSIDPGSYNCEVTNNGDATVVSQYDDPGALLILGNDLRLTGNIDYYGLVYVEGNVAGEASHAGGKPVIHGMLYCVECPSTGEGGNIDLKGHASVRFNANAARYLGSQFVTSVRLLDNGWRELSPTVSPSP